MTISDALLALVGASTPVGYNTGGGVIFPDHLNDVAYFRETGTGTGTAGLKKFTAGVVGTETLQATETTTFGAGPAHTLANQSGCYHPMGQLFMPVDSDTNSQAIAKIDATTLAVTEIAGLPSSSFTPSQCDGGGVLARLLASFQMIALQRTGAHLLVSRGITVAGAEREVAVLNVTTTGAILLLSAVNVNEQVAGLCPGASGVSIDTATFFVVGRQFNYAGGDPTPAALYKYQVYDNSIAPAHVYDPINEAVARTILRASIAPTDIDATWTNFSAISDPGYDQADGAVLLIFSTLDAVTNQNYLAKFDGTTGALLWAIAIPQNLTQLALPICNISRVLAGFERELVGTSYGFVIDLRTGASSTVLFNRGLSGMDQQVFNSLLGTITGVCGYSEGSGPIPTYLGAYLAANANAIPGNRWGRIWLGPTAVAQAARSYVEVF